MAESLIGWMNGSRGHSAVECPMWCSMLKWERFNISSSLETLGYTVPWRNGTTFNFLPGVYTSSACSMISHSPGMEGLAGSHTLIQRKIRQSLFSSICALSQPCEITGLWGSCCLKTYSQEVALHAYLKVSQKLQGCNELCPSHTNSAL